MRLFRVSNDLQVTVDPPPEPGKLCIDCKWLEKKRVDLYICRRPMERSLVDGGVRTRDLLAEIERTDHGKDSFYCGPRGLWWEPKA